MIIHNKPSSDFPFVPISRLGGDFQSTYGRVPGGRISITLFMVIYMVVGLEGHQT